MSSNPLRLQVLFRKYVQNSCTKQELKEFWQLVGDASENDLLDQDLEDIWNNHQEEVLVKQGHKDRLLTKIFETAKQREFDYAALHKNPWPKRLAVAAIFMLIATSAYLLFNSDGSQTPQVAETTTKQQPLLTPGKDGAILTLADGTQIVLDDTKDGNVTDVAVKDGNKVSYENSSAAKVEYNTMSTPRGRQYSLVLADGSKVWLNAASSITFPTAFTGRERKVEITGEAYFEVAHNASQPFKVSVNGTEVEVLGTHFNLNAYYDDALIKITLLEGSVKVSSTLDPSVATIIRPGQQARLSTVNRQLSTVNPNMEEVMAWKNGLFQFNGADIQSIMKQAERWYDVEVEINGNITEKFSGQINRNVNASELFRILESTGKISITVVGKNVQVKAN